MAKTPITTATTIITSLTPYSSSMSCVCDPRRTVYLRPEVVSSWYLAGIWT